MKGKLIFANDKNEIITADIDISMKDTKGLYSKGESTLLDFGVVGIQWLEMTDEEKGL